MPNFLFEYIKAWKVRAQNGANSALHVIEHIHPSIFPRFGLGTGKVNIFLSRDIACNTLDLLMIPWKATRRFVFFVSFGK
jgi:hypothetical protein